MFNAVADEAEKAPLPPTSSCPFTTSAALFAPDWHSMWPNMRVQMEFLSSGTATSPIPPVVSHFTWQQPFGKKTLLIWLDNLFSHINSGPTRANEKCVINVRRLNASRMCSSSASAPRRGPDNYYPAALKDMRAQISDTYILTYMYIHI